jgi:hypothetical protein
VSNTEIQHCGVASQGSRQSGGAPIDAQSLDVAQWSAS